MTLEMSKNLGGIGAILIVIAGLGVFGTMYVGILGLIGIILVLIAVKGLADNYGEGGIFNNALYAIIMGIIGFIAFAGIAIYAVFTQIFSLLDLTEGDWAGLSTALQQRITSGDMSFIWDFLATIILAWVVLSICIIVAVIFSRKSLNLASAKTGVGMFGTAGILMLIGGILSIIFIGFILIWIAWILIAVAFFSIRTQPTQPQQPPPTPV
jgi:uncharacterized membrane protein